jgi:small subunit ribosomal protein S3
MSHTVHPYAHRLGIIRDWKSRWFSNGKKYRENLHSDILIREYLDIKLKGMNVGDVNIERDDKKIRIIVASSRPGLIIGRSGEGVTKLRDNLIKLLKKKNYLEDGVNVKIDVEEIRYPESNAMVVAQMVQEAMEKRMPFRRVLKQTAEKVMSNRDVKGVRIVAAGRLGGAEMARTEGIKKGRANLAYGVIGLKVWIYKGDILNRNNK